MRRILNACFSFGLCLGACLIVRYALASGASDSASGASASQTVAGLASLVTSGVMAQQCTSTKNPSTCTMAALAATQAISLASTAAAATDAATDTSTATTTATATPDTTDYGSLSGTSAVQNESTARSVLADEGYSLSDDASTLTTPSGSSVSAASMSGESGMSSAGLNAAQIAQAKSALLDAQKAASAAVQNAMAVEESGGGGAGRAASRPEGATITVVQVRKRAPSLAGMSRNIGDEKIGVSGDDIFEMISRRYKAQDEQFLFIRN